MNDMRESPMRQTCINVLERLESIDEMKGFYGFHEQLELYRNRVQDRKFRIAVVGEFSSGKSTFINALLGKDILNHALTETTATITRIVNTNKNDPCCYTGIVKMRDGQELQLDNIEDLKDYTTTSSGKYHVVDDIESVDIYMPLMDANHPMEIVDTPGLNGTADGHRSRTIELIQKSHACLYLIQRRGLTDSDIAFLNYLKSIQKNYIFIQNFIDDLRENDRAEDLICAQERTLSEKVFSQEDHVNYCVCGLSAWLALVGRDISIKRVYEDDIDELSNEKRIDLFKKSRFEEFITILSERFSDKNLDLIQYGDTALSMSDWLDNLSQMMAFREKNARETGKLSNDARATEKLKRLKEKTLNGQEHQKIQLKSLIISELERISREKTLQVEDHLEIVRQELEKNALSVKSLEDMEKFIESIPNRIRYMLSELTEKHFERLEQSTHNLRQTLLQRIQEYSGIEDIPQIESLTVKVDTEKKNYDFRIQTEIDRLNEQKNDLMMQRDNKTQILTTLQQQKRQSSVEVKSKQSAVNDVEVEKKRAFDRQGRRPEVVQRERLRERTEYRGGLGILDAIFGPKIVKYTEIYDDDSDRRRWDAERAQLNNRYAEKRASLERELSAARRKEKRLIDEASDAKNELERLSSRIQSINELIKEQEKTLEMEQIHAKKQLLDKRRNDLVVQIRDYLIDGEDSVKFQIRGETLNYINE